MHVRLLDVDRGASIASPTPSPWPTTFAITCMIAPRNRIEPALPTTSLGRPPPTTIVGAIMLVRRRPGSVEPAPTRSYSPSMLLSWMPVPGTITPEPEPVEDETDAAFPSASTTETWVVPPCGACSGAPGTTR